MGNNRDYKRNAYESMQRLDARVASLYSKAIRLKNPRSVAIELREGYKALLQAIRNCHHCELIYTNLKDVEHFLMRMGLLKHQEPTGKHYHK